MQPLPNGPETTSQRPFQVASEARWQERFASEITAVLVLAVAFLACSNGANDNFKGVATLVGSGTCGYRAALVWATATTLAGSLLALVLAEGLIDTIKGKGLVPDAVTVQREFLIAVSLGAAATVLLATRLGMPVSTTHAFTA